MYLLNTNILLEVMLGQEKAAEVKSLMGSIPPEHLFITEFTLYSVCIRLVKEKKQTALRRFILDLLSGDGLSILRANLEDCLTMNRLAGELQLSFDDAYQYVTAEKHNLTIISFDADFDLTKRGRKTPAEVL